MTCKYQSSPSPGMREADVDLKKEGGEVWQGGWEEHEAPDQGEEVEHAASCY